MPVLRKRVKTNSKIKKQQTLILSKNFCPFNFCLNNKVKIASDKTENKQK